MVTKLSYTANSITLGTGTSKVILGADSGNLIVKDSDANTSILEPGLGVQGGSSVTTYANPGALPFSPISPAGSLAYTTSTGALYMSNGSGWYKITLVNTAPSISLSSTTANPNKNALTLDFTYTVTEPEGTPVNITLANSGIATTGNVAITHTTSNNHIRLVFDGTTEYTGDATVTLSVTDGVNTGTGTITITTAYYNKLNTRYNAVLLKTKTVNSTIPTTQKSLYFDGTGDYLTSTLVDTAGTGEFTAEAFFYATALSTSGATGAIMAQRATTPTTGNYAQWIVYTQNTGNLGWYNGVSGQRVVETGAGGIEVNRWYHVAITRNSSNVMTMWLDGVSVGTRSGQTQNWNYSPFSVGANGDGTAPFQGYISNVRWTPGTAIYTSDFIVPTSPLTAVTNTKFLVAQGTTTDNSGEGETVTTAGDVTASNNSPFESGIKNTFVDASSSNHVIKKNGTVSQSSYSPFREPGYAVDFAGEWLKIKNATFTFGTGDYTIEGWIFPHGTGNCDVIDLRGSGFDQGVALTLKSGNKIWPYYGGSQFTTGNIAINPNVWSHIALVRTSGTLKAFVNGLQDFSVSDTTNRNGTSQRDMAIGANYGGASKFDGILYDWRVTTNAVYTSNFSPPTEPLTAISGTVLHVLRGSRIADYSSNAYVLEGQGNDSQRQQIAFTPYDRDNAYSVSNHGGSVFHNNGDSNYLEIPASSDHQIYGGDYTVEAWLYPTAFNTSYNYFITKGGNTTREWGFSISASNIIVYWSTNGSSSGDATVTKTADNNLYEWTHVAFTKSGNTITIYKNGISLGTGTFTSIYSGNGVTTVGRLWQYTGISHQYSGYISNLRIVKGSVVYSSNFTPPTSPVTAITNTKLLLNFGDAKIFDASQSQKDITLHGSTHASSLERHFSENTIALDGDSDYIELSEPAIPILSERDYTIDFWFYSKDTNRKDFVNQYTSGGSGRMGLYSESAKIKFYQNNIGSALTGPTSWTTNAWHHVVLQNTHEYRHIYLNGVHQGAQYGAGDDMQSVNTKIGALNSSGSTHSGFLNGYMHDVRITKDLARYPYYSNPVTLTTTNSGMTKPDGTTVTVSASDVLLLTCHTGTAGSSTITDGSNNNTTISQYGNAVVSDFGPGPGMKSVYFDGAGDYLQCTLADTLGTDDWTIEYWVYHINLDDNDIHCAFGTYAPAFYYRHGSTAFAYYSGGHNTNIENPEPHRWYHMVYSHDASENKMMVFVDGTFIEEVTYNGNISSSTFRIGDDSTSAWMDGYISNLRIVKGQVLYTNSFTPVTDALE